MRRNIFLLIIGVLFMAPSVMAQNTIETESSQTAPKPENVSGKYKRTLEIAEFLFEERNYLRALVMYDSLIEAYPSEFYFQYQSAICNINKSDGREDAISILKGLDGVYKGHNDVKYYIGRAYHLLYEFDKALISYNQFLKEAKPKGERRTYVNFYIENCKTGRQLMERRTNLALEILIPPSTSQSSQYSPVLSADGAIMAYTNRGEENIGGLMVKTMKERPEGDYFEDIWISEKAKEGWEKGKSIPGSINTAGHEAPMSFSPDGKKLFLYKSNKNSKEDIYISELFEGEWTTPELVPGMVNSVHWEGSACLTRDEQLLYFSSDRPGGYGGRDIWVAEWQESIWTNITNLGPTINTTFDEDGPFFHSEGNSLYFASVGHNSMGGYDIFYTQRLPDSTWTEPINIGYPINTTDDDRFYVVSDDGKSGYFSSARASGENRHDIYEVKPGSFDRMTNLVVLFGNVQVDGKPAVVQLLVEDATNGKPLGEFVTDIADGAFRFKLLPSKKYKITMITEGAEPMVEYVEVKNANQTFIRLEKNFKLYTFAYAMLHGERDTESLGRNSETDIASLVVEEGTSPQPIFTETIDDIEARRRQEEADRFYKLNADGFWVLDREDELEEMPEGMWNVGLSFRVQVGAYRNPGRFTYGFLRQVGTVEIKTYPDGITRYLMAPYFKTKAEAEPLRQACIKAGQEDAWITIR